MTDAKLNILFPIETINRELDYRLFLAAVCLTDRNRIFIGDPASLLVAARSMRNGVYLGKHIFQPRFRDTNLKAYRLLKERGFVVLWLTEEGAVMAGKEKEWRENLLTQMDPHALAPDDHVLCWGLFQAEVYRSTRPACLQNIHATGTPRLGIYKEPYRCLYLNEAEKLSKQFGRFILINTNLPMANNGQGLLDTFSRRLGLDPKQPSKRGRVFREFTFATKRFANFITLINEIHTAYPDRNIVIRPHPSEDWNTYRTIFRGFQNIHTLHEGAVAPWLMACDVLIHDGCTTAIEAWLLDKPIITFESEPNPEFVLTLPNDLGVKCRSPEEVVRELSPILEGRFVRTESPTPNSVKQLLANADGDALQMIREILIQLEKRGNPEDRGFYPAQLNRRIQMHQLKEILKWPIRHLTPHRRAIYKYSRQKFNSLDSANAFGRIKEIEKITGRKIICRRYSPSLLSIEAPQF